MKWHACLASLAAGMALTPVAHAQLDSRTPYPADNPDMVGNLDFETVLPGGVTPLMTLDEVASRLTPLGYSGSRSISSIGFRISSGLSGPTPLPSGEMTHVRSDTIHRIAVWYSSRDPQSVQFIDAQMYFDFECDTRLKAALGEPDQCSGEPGESLFYCRWDNPGTGYKVTAEMVFRSHICKIRMDLAD